MNRQSKRKVNSYKNFLLYKNYKILFIFILESTIGDHKTALLDVSKSSKPVSPALPEHGQSDEDHRFCNYLEGIMKDIPKSRKLQLQAKIINMVINEHNNII